MANKTLLFAEKPFTQLAKNKAIYTWEQLLDYIQNLPYGRNSQRANLHLVLLENKGTCSSKHAFLKQVAVENNFNDVTLVLGMYKMNATNTPGIGNVLEEHKLPYLPEAHCYLKIKEERIDLTSPTASIQKIENDILEEQEINAQQIMNYKVLYHKHYLQNWASTNYPKLSFNLLWKLREQCILNLQQ